MVKGRRIDSVCSEQRGNCAITFGTHWAGGIVNNLFTVMELELQLKLSGAKGLTTHLVGLDVAWEAPLSDCLSTALSSLEIPNPREG